MSHSRERLFDLMQERGFVIFRGSLTPFPTLRTGCMGAFDQTTMRAVVQGDRDIARGDGRY